MPEPPSARPAASDPASPPPLTGRVLVAHQPAYLPWQGYFARLLDVDQLVVLDHVQFAERGWQHRNYVAGLDARPVRLSVPVRRARRFGQRLCEVELADAAWGRRHWRTIHQLYRRAAFFDHYAAELHAIYQRPWRYLVDVNLTLTRLLLGWLGLPVTLVRSSTLELHARKTALLVELCALADARVLRTGVGALGYLDRPVLARAGIELEVIDFAAQPYRRGHGAFLPYLSVLDSLLHCGPAARDHLAAGRNLRRHPPEGGEHAHLRAAAPAAAVR